MSAPDGDDDELVDIEIELDGPPPSPEAEPRAEEERRAEWPPPLTADDKTPIPTDEPVRPFDANRSPAMSEATPRAVEDPPSRPPPPPPGGPPDTTGVEESDIIELRAPIVEAAEADGRADIALYEAEAAAADDPARRAVLLLEIARLAEITPSVPGAGQAEALDAARRAFSAAPALTIALWALRRHLVRAKRFDELADAYAQAAHAGAAEARAPEERADLVVERGWLLAAPLGRAADATAAFHEALQIAPDHPGALLSLLLFGASQRDAAAVGVALEGLARRADDDTRRTALAIEAAGADMAGPEGAARALALLEAELARASDTTPVGTLLAEIEPLTRVGAAPETTGRALAEIARRAGAIDPRFAVALWRERARLLAREPAGRDEALAALDEAARLDPTHPLVAAERLELAEALGRGETADAIAREHVDAAGSDDEAADFALLHAAIARRAGREMAGATTLATPRVGGRRAARADLRAFELAVAAGRHDPAALAELWLAEAALAGGGRPDEGAARSHALAAAAVLRQGPLGDPAAAEMAYRRALAAAPADAAALEALVALLGAASRPAEATELVEAALAAGLSGPREAWALEALVSFYATDLGDPARALPHQQRLVALAPDDVGRRVRLRDLELGVGVALGEAGAAEWLALADRAGDAGVSAALRVEAGRALAGSADPEARRRGLALLDELLPVDGSGLAAAALEQGAAPPARAEVVARELEAAAGAPAEIVRALRFRLAHHHATEGRYAEALAALTPLRSEGDPLARSWSYELARRSGEAILEVAVLSEDSRTTDAPLGTEESLLLAHGEALARAGDPSGAADMLRRALAATPTGPAGAEAALALFRIAASETRGPRGALAEALRTLAAACTDEPALAALAAREEQLERVAAGVVEDGDLEPAVGADAADRRGRAERAVVQFVAGVRLGNARAVGQSLGALAVCASEEGIGGQDGVAALFGRALSRARLGGVEVADAVARDAWRASRTPALALAISDLPSGPDGGVPADRPETRRARARRAGHAVGIALELEVAADAERRGALGSALVAYGAVIDLEPERLEAWTGIRRVARASGDVLGEARALARLGALVRDPDRAGELLIEAANLYERADRVDDAVTSLAKAVELQPGDAATAQRLYDLLRVDLDAPGRAELFDNLLSHRLVAASLSPAERAALLYERAQHRLRRLGAREAAFTDLEQILNILPEHREALFALARGAIDDGDARGAVVWLERFVAAARDDARAPAARLDLAAAYEAIKDRVRAAETLRRAAAARVQDPLPLERLADLQLRAGDWRGAIEAMRGAEARMPEARERGALQLRVGGVLRDLGRDAAGAAASFAKAAELDPLGEGTQALIALHDAAGDRGGALEIVGREIARVRQALAADPLDARLLGRLGQFLATARERGIAEPIAEAEEVVSSLLGLLGERPAATPATAPRFAPSSGPALFAEASHPAAGGFIAEVWPNLLEAAAALFPAPASRDRRAAAPPAWVAGAAVALGVGPLAVAGARDADVRLVTAFEDPAPGLIVAAGAEADPAFGFVVGRALGLLVQRATILERASADDLAPLFACAAIVAGASPPRALPQPSEEMLRTVTRALGRKPRKALALQASRFEFEAFDVRAWHEGVLRTADRMGLLIGGDIATAAVALARLARTPASASDSGPAPTPPVLVATSGAALELVRFALGDRYPALRRAAGGG